MNKVLREQEQQYESLKKAKAESEDLITKNFLAVVKEKDDQIDEVTQNMRRLCHSLNLNA